VTIVTASIPASGAAAWPGDRTAAGEDERDVIKIRLGRKKAHTIYSVPESVAVRIHTRLLNSR
jgi:hypothetical protein